jgi:hypothetical protein
MQAIQVFPENLVKVQDWCPDALFYIDREKVIDLSEDCLKEYRKNMSICVLVSDGKFFAINQCWIVKHDDGTFTTMTDQLFRYKYEPVPGSFPDVRKKG